MGQLLGMFLSVEGTQVGLRSTSTILKCMGTRLSFPFIVVFNNKLQDISYLMCCIDSNNLAKIYLEHSLISSKIFYKKNSIEIYFSPFMLNLTHVYWCLYHNSLAKNYPSHSLEPSP